MDIFGGIVLHEDDQQVTGNEGGKYHVDKAVAGHLG
jgi:hypothetical protein